MARAKLFALRDPADPSWRLVASWVLGWCARSLDGWVPLGCPWGTPRKVGPRMDPVLHHFTSPLSTLMKGPQATWGPKQPHHRNETSAPDSVRTIVGLLHHSFRALGVPMTL